MSTFSKCTFELACSNRECPDPTFPASDVLFMCSYHKCYEPMPNQPASIGRYTLFEVDEFRPIVQCPHCRHDAYLLRCPRCFKRLPLGISERSTIAVVGARSSGKTCYITCLLHQIQKELAKPTSLCANLLSNDDAGRAYHDVQWARIFKEHRLPDLTSIHQVPENIYLKMQFRLRPGWLRNKRPRREVPLLFPDPAGDLFESLEETYFQAYLRNASALILLIDPTPGGEDPAKQKACFDNLISVVQKGSSGQINKALAVVLTKCDETGVFDPDLTPSDCPRQGSRYNPRLARRLGSRVEHYINEELKHPELVTTARNNFQRVEYFAVSALGETPLADGSLTAPVSPRRVEEPLLWILNGWGHKI